MNKLILAKSAGFCYGVRRAVERAEQSAEASIPYVMLGPVIHNSQVIEHLARMGVGCVEHLQEIPGETGAIIRSHGVGRPIYKELKERKIPIIDATCPNVSRIHKLAVDAEK
ncbi:MAG: bifunctional 4-hydroxy-3-methylbut-2-enyl diphosphate reductase/30S ribosomal protein S1, partial [Oscillospiraceae bacterium]|nr:bifunctional 4-hydroxy-3-methylbut-2-enyl diphosphate reductase/30S ribosomal protein S1 [Oscillospiraceae bacterium]